MALFTHIDCFAGPGGFCCGLHAAGFNTLVAIECIKDCVDTYTKNHPDVHVIHDDIRNVTENDILPYIPADGVDLVTSGMPCETFSLAGTDSRNSFDHRQFLFREGIRIAQISKAKFLLFENVHAITKKKVSKDSKELVLDVLKRELIEAGYSNFKEIILNAKDFGVPQTRKRYFIIATKNQEIDFKNIIEEFELAPRYVTVKEAFCDLGCGCTLKELGSGNEGIGYDNIENPPPYIRLMKNDAFWRREGFGTPFHYHVIPVHKDYMVERFNLLGPLEGLNELFDRYEGTPEFEELRARKVLPNERFSQSGRRLATNMVSFVVTSHVYSEIVHPKEPRALSVRECARLQSFPDSYDFCGGEYRCRYNYKDRQSKFEQIGDAVPPLLAYAWGEVIKKLIEKVG